MTDFPEALRNAVIITGATGSGKSALALELAEQFNGEILALDSMTLYKGMSIGTAKPSQADQRRVPHHLLDLLEVWEAGNVAWWLDQALRCCEEIQVRGKVPIFVGGTPMYLKALLHGLAPAPPADAVIRQKWEAFAAEQGSSALHGELQNVDPITAARLHVNDVRRVVRALEIWSITGQPMSSQVANWDDPPRPIPGLVLDWPREVLYQRIEARVEAMLASGWLEELKLLQSGPRPMSQEAKQALGYRELLDFLDGQQNWADTVTLIKTHTRQFAKRQLTWFRSFSSLNWLSAQSENLLEAAAKILGFSKS